MEKNEHLKISESCGERTHRLKKKKKVENKRIMRLKKCMGQIKKKKNVVGGKKLRF